MAETHLPLETKNEKPNLHRYWRFWIPAAVILALMVKFPLRIDLRESTLDGLFYGSISFGCLVMMVRVYWRFGNDAHRLMAIILLCALLSSWQVIDMMILREEGPSAHTYASSSNIFEPLHDGWAWYNLRFPDRNIMCHSLFEQYVGNHILAIAYNINREATWFACGG
ncbi:MAG: hypothetical protein LCI00_24655 [Chloroflexi bacterium]|nr:hypothetical protein [Chloroflexota bacterium]MCC6895823.1 hypothetical protein [Anaerolineae bacterium]